jgi:outer membrane PBP1 activator LpoA protein
MQPGALKLAWRCIPLVLALALAGCPTIVRPPAERVPDAETADKLARAGQNAQAAEMFEKLAATRPAPEQARFRLRAAELWFAAGERARAQRILDELGDLTPDQLRARGLLAAEIAIAANMPDRALQLLRELPPSGTPSDSAQLLALQARAQFVRGDAASGVRALLAREQWVQGGDLVANRREIADALRAAAAQGVSLTPPRGADPLLAGWLELGAVLIELDRNPFAARANVNQWRGRYPQHPANSGILEQLLRENALSLEYPTDVALLLPLSGRQQAAGTAVRDGFLSAYFQQDPAQRPRIRVYDVAGEEPGSAYLRAVEDGAQFVVGPLTKDEVNATADIAEGRLPVLALNFLTDGRSAPPEFFQFALHPEDEARQVAQRVVADGHPRGVVLVPDGEWGSRVLAAFQDELGTLGGSLIASSTYDPAQSDYTGVIQQLLRLSDSRERYARLSNTLGVKLEFEPRRRGDIDFIFVAAQPSHGRLIRPQLRFHYAGDIPTYMTSDAFEPDEVANVDLDGIVFADMPWMISLDPVSTQLRDTIRSAWPARATRRGRLYAFGFDAYRLIPVLRARRVPVEMGVSGMTGRLSLDEQGRIRRDLDWAQIRQGRPQVLAIQATPPPPAQ